MALIPSLHPMVLGSYSAPHTLEIFLDYVCPFSAKMTVVIDNTLKMWLERNGKYHGRVKAIIRQQVQPWHASSMLTHEAVLAVTRVNHEAFWPYHVMLMRRQADFFDLPTCELTPQQIRTKLADLARPLVGDDGVDKVHELLRPTTTPNGGNDVTDELKYIIKVSRQNGIHVSPTVLWDGLVANEVSSSWDVHEWNTFLSEKVTVA